MTPEEHAKHLSIKRLVCGCGEADCPRYAKVVDVIRVAVAEGRAAALEDALEIVHEEHCAAIGSAPTYAQIGSRIEYRIRSLLNQGRDEVAPSLEKKK